MQAVETPRDPSGLVDYNQGWKLWSDMLRFYPSGVHRRRMVARWLARLGPRSVLDAGCGAGHMLAALRERLPGAQFIGIDAAAGTIAENRMRLPWGRFEHVDLGRGRLDERFDAVVCSEVLEHIEDDRRALGNLAAMTGRYLMLTVPAGPIMPLERGFGHLRHYRLRELGDAVESLGLRVLRAEAWGFPWMNLFKRAANLRPQSTMSAFGAGEWSWRKKAVGVALTGLFYCNLPVGGPQIFLLAERL
jgi:SAM-dependent methyltransferase